MHHDQRRLLPLCDCRKSKNGLSPACWDGDRSEVSGKDFPQSVLLIVPKLTIEGEGHRRKKTPVVLDLELLAGIADDRKRLPGECPREGESAVIRIEVAQFSGNVPRAETFLRALVIGGFGKVSRCRNASANAAGAFAMRV